jgi:hypothetical protein
MSQLIPSGQEKWRRKAKKMYRKVKRNFQEIGINILDSGE